MSIVLLRGPKRQAVLVAMMAAWTVSGSGRPSPAAAEESEAKARLPTEPVAPGEASAFQPNMVVTHLPERPVANGGPSEEISLAPYGCTKFRVSMFPITEQAFAALKSESAVGSGNK
ncbi:MAG: hypothetical protein KA354_12310 [Phycisphaerae bacterium]|nr:hypothetical protein [Phycisphaerae bacterium]